MFDRTAGLNRDLTELNKVEKYLKNKNIKYVRRDNLDGYMDFHQLIGENVENWIWDVICHFGSYGCDEGLLELMWGDEEPEGWLTADDVIGILEKRLEK